MSLLPYAGYSLTITPPAASKFVPATLTPYSVTNNTLNNISLNKSIAEFVLSTKISGTAGSVTSSPAGINCTSGTCSWYFDTGTVVTLTAGSNGFLGWSGACSGSSATCILTMSANQTVAANYPDSTPPVLTLSTLKDKAITNNAILNISGTVTDNVAVASLTVNGKPVTPNPIDGSFSYPFTLQTGDNLITTAASDAIGNTTTDTRTITLDQTAPNLAVSTPADNIKTAVSSILVSGTVDETSTVNVTDNAGTPQSAAMTGNTFSTAISLVSGLNTVSITATDLAGNVSTVKRTILFDDTKPTLAVTDPAQDGSTTQSTMVIKGTVADTITNPSITITVDGSSYSPVVINGAFSQQVTFASEKTYQINVTATDEVGNATTVQRNIVYSSQSNGDLNGDGVVDVGDALLALRIAVGLAPMDPKYLLNGDVAPLVNGKPQPDGIIDVGDALLILRKCVLLVSW